MRIAKRIALTTAGLALAAAAVAALTRGGPEPESAAGTPLDLVYALPFRLDEPYTHWWRSERPQVRAGHLLVLAVDGESVVPRQVAEPVLYVGAETAERINSGHLDGALVVLVPSEPGPDGWPTRDLAAEPIWFGEPGLPEQVDRAAAAGALARARALGILPLEPSRVDAALSAAGAPRRFADREELDRFAVEVLRTYAPSERDLAEGMSVPR